MIKSFKEMLRSNTKKSDIFAENDFNGISRNCIVITGVPGSGTGYMLKKKLVDDVSKNSNKKQFIILDTYGEITNYIDDIIPKAAVSNVVLDEFEDNKAAALTLNPLDLFVVNAASEYNDYLCYEKAIFVKALISLIFKRPLEQREAKIIDDSVNKLYEPYLEFIKDTGRQIDTTQSPTMKDLIRLIGQRDQFLAERLKKSLIQPYYAVYKDRTNTDLAAGDDIVFNNKPYKNEESLIIASMLELECLKTKVQMIRSREKRVAIYMPKADYIFAHPEISEYFMHIIKPLCKKYAVEFVIELVNISEAKNNPDIQRLMNSYTSVFYSLGQSSTDAMMLDELFNTTAFSDNVINACIATGIRLEGENVIKFALTD